MTNAVVALVAWLFVGMGCAPPAVSLPEGGGGSEDDGVEPGDDDDSAEPGDDDDSASGGDDDDSASGTPCDLHLSPTGTGGGDGSVDFPWPSLAEAAEAGLLPLAGGVVCLLPGHHGAPVLENLSPSSMLELRAWPEFGAVVASLAFERVQLVTVDGLVVDGSTLVDPGQDQRGVFLVRGDLNTSDITLRGLLVESAVSSTSWTWQDWTDLAFSGIDFRGPAIHIEDSVVRNVHHALSVRGDGSTVVGNLIDNFGGDGIRGHGSGSLYEWNTVRDAYIDEYEVQHDDGFQAYRLEGEDLRIADVVIRHNRFLLFTDPITQFVLDEELVGTLMQGIIVTDGYADGWIVENNLVVNAHAHGITLYGGRNCRVQGNTVVRHPAFVAETGPWVRIADQTKSNHANFDNVIRNNLTTMLTPWDYDSTSLVEANLEVEDPETEFMDAAGFDFTPALGSPAVDTGIATDLVSVDLAGAARLVGASVDVGAFERP